MSRLHLFEIHDSPRCPAAWRDGLTAFLQWNIDVLGIYDCIIPRMKTLMADSGTDTIVDLCSGGGGPWKRLHAALEEALGHPVKVTLTDKFPNTESLETTSSQSPGSIRFVHTSVDASDVPKDLSGARTLFTSFHHFKPEDAQKILQDAVNKKAPIAIFEFTDRTVLSLLAMLFAPALALIVVPFLRPFSWKRLFSCVPLPILPLVITFDGIVSNLRTYSVQELEAMTDRLTGPDYQWEATKIRQGPIRPPVTLLIGKPLRRETRKASQGEDTP